MNKNKLPILLILLLSMTILAIPIVSADITIEDVSPTTTNFPYNHAWEHSVSGKMQALAVAPSDENRLYTGSYSGIWRSDDGGKNWKQLTRPQPSQGINDVPGSLSVPNIIDIAVSPVNKDLVLVAARRDTRINSLDGIYRSTNGGEEWSLVHQRIQFE